LKRRTFLSQLGMIALSGARIRAANALPLPNIHPNFLPNVPIGLDSVVSDSDALRPFRITLPRHVEPLPFGSERSGSRPAFPIRGLKGWAWSPQQYLAEIPILAKYRLNFLTNCYSSLWELGPGGALGNNNINFWYRPLSPEKKAGFEKVIRACQERGIIFCFSVNPNLRSDRAFDYERAEDMNALWQHYEWSQKLGVKWFNFSLDDIDKGINAGGQARAVNAIFQRLRAQDPEAQLTFCPTWYSGTGQSGIETNTTLGIEVESGNIPGGAETPGVQYTKTLAQQLHPDVYMVWTGPDVCSLTISADQARSYRALCGHRLLLFDNYPVNDQHPALHLGPFRGRSADLYTAIDGYFLNSMSYQVEANRIPLLTLSDYLWNPQQYDSDRSIGQAIVHLADTPARRRALRDLVELYPGRLWDNSKSTEWNSLRMRFDQLLQRGEQSEAHKLLANADATRLQMKALFPSATASGETVLDQDVAAMSRRFE
jgi:beta-N-acetylglucosaminidase